ncbi:MAG: DNA cytosine methyltransferase [Gammaproteobacteria bacterium]|nr:DNA cytosine methyltransferase [Gammaproteobacteria bacterium]
MSKPVKIIDLFAGPGGLGEGFSAYRPDGKQAFKIAISIEKEDSAHRTLLLRSLFRQFEHNKVPDAYYSFLRGELGKHPEDKLYQHPDIKEHLEKARKEAQKIELGKVKPADVYKKIRDAVGKDECILIGGPPCQAYSLVGRARNAGIEDYVDTEDHRNYLYKEYLKIISKFQPKVFVMENVKGILSAKVGKEKIFDSIREDLQNPYNASKVKADKGRKKHEYKIYSLVTKTEDTPDPHDFIVRTENYGIPQARHRVILLGVRKDIADKLDDFERLQTVDNMSTVRHAISDLPNLRSRLSKIEDSTDAWRDSITSINKEMLSQLENDDHVPNNVYKELVEQINKIEISPSKTGKDKGLKKTNSSYNVNLSSELQEWYKDDKLGDFTVNHESRGHIVSDLHRYIYYSTFAKVKEVSPKSNNLPKVLWPDHKNFETGKFADRFRVQRADYPGTTVTSHISKDGHYFIHYEPKQCRSFTVREAARIQTFPDNYYFVGNRTEQYVQVGNAVPPFLAMKIAKIVFDIIKK